jgi:hypothetical protein
MVDSEASKRFGRVAGDDRQQLLEMYAVGVAVDTIAMAMDVDRSTVFRHLRLGDKIIRRGGPKLTEHDVDRAIGLYERGETLKSIGVGLGVHGDTVRRALVIRGVVIGSVARATRPRKLDVDSVSDCRRRLEAGEKLTSLASEYEVSRETIRRSIDRERRQKRG